MTTENKKLIKIDTYECQRQPYFIHNNYPKKEKNQVLGNICYENDQIKEAFYSDYLSQSNKETGITTVDLRGFDELVRIERTKEALQQFDNVHILNFAVARTDMPYYAGNILLTKRGVEVDLHILKLTTSDKLYKSSHKAQICRTWQQLNNAVLHNDLFKEMTVNFKVVHLSKDSTFIEITELDKSQFTNKFISNKIPKLYDRLDKEPECTYGRHCKQCSYQDECNIPEFSTLDFDLSGQNWRKADELINKYNSLDINKLDVKEVEELGELNTIRYSLNKATSKQYIYVNQEVIREYIDQVKDGAFHLDFETIMFTQSYNDMPAGVQLPFSFSLLKDDDLGGTNVSRWVYIVSPSEENLKQLPLALFGIKELVESNKPIVVYHADFEKTVLRTLKEMSPMFTDTIYRLIDRIIDLELVFKKGGIYTKGQKNNSLKTIADLYLNNHYDVSEINNGEDCSAIYKTLFMNNNDDAQQLNNISKYNYLDVLAQVLITQGLHPLSKV